MPAVEQRSRGRLGWELTALALVGVLLVGSVWAGGTVLYRSFYSATAFVQHYLDLLQDGRAADALAVPGVSLDSADLDAAGLPASASQVLLRSAALGRLGSAAATSETVNEDGTTTVVVEFAAGGHDGTTSLTVRRTGSIGLLPVWAFAESPLAVMNLTVLGSMTFEVNGFTLDKRQISPDGADADPVEPLSMLVFSPGIYSISVDSAIATTPGVAVLTDAPMVNVPVQVQADPTDEFLEVVQERVEEFLVECTTQQVLQPTGCPFGAVIRNRVESAPTWSITTQPEVTVEPDGAQWRIPDAAATAHLDVDIRLIADGSYQEISEDVPFVVNGTISVLADGSVSIRVGGYVPDLR